MRRCCTPVLCLALLASAPVRGDVAPPVSIRLPERGLALAGQEYRGVFEVRLASPGTLTDLKISGEGWNLLWFDAPACPLPAAVGTIRVAFRAVPSDPDKPIGLELKFDGRTVRRQYSVGPKALAKRTASRTLIGVPDAAHPAQPPAKPPGGARGGTLVASGRIAYDRPGRDLSNPPDGDFTDPEDIPPLELGADRISVALLDNDPIDFEIMWTGVTDEYGRFTTPPLATDVDTDGSGPDLVLEAAALHDEWGGVFDPNGDWFYVWTGAEVEDFEGAEYHYGTQKPLDGAEHPAVHAWNSLVRTRRYILEHPQYDTPPVTLVWPDAGWSRYNPADQEIMLFTEHSWMEDVVVHEYGHHFIHRIHEPPPPNYANNLCDAGSPEGMCFPNGGTWSPGPGHCVWCEENANDAFNEGWPNWLADVVLRDFPVRYAVDAGGEPLRPLFTRNDETPQTCCVDGTTHDATQTEGFVGALLRDIDDATQDDHDGDGILDQLCTGPDPIFHVLFNYHPNTVADFMNGFLADYGSLDADFRATAFNVGGSAYVTFPPDAQAPGLVTVLDSSTHPLGVGGFYPCIQFEFVPAADDLSGATQYSYAWTTHPGGESPDNVADLVFGADSCRSAGMIFPFAVGQFYISIRSGDTAGNWNSGYTTFGPFEIDDCNGNGFVDVCDTDCNSSGIPGLCSVGGGQCVNAACGSSADCNGNFQPDECDIAQGFSEDCNLDGVPDECQEATLKHWRGGDSTCADCWHSGANWEEGAPPADGDHVCVANDLLAPRLSQTQVALQTLACDNDLGLFPAAGTGGVTLTLDGPSFITGDLTMGVFPRNPQLIVNDVLTIHGALNWSVGTLQGAGQTDVLGGHSLTGTVHVVNHLLNLHCDSLSVGTLLGSSSTIRNFPGFTYTQSEGILHQGNSLVFRNEGTIHKPSGAGLLRIDSACHNYGEILGEQGAIRFGSGLISYGDIYGAPSTTLQFNGSQTFEPGSSVIGDQIIFDTSAAPNSRFVRGTYDAGIGTTFSNGANVVFEPGANVIDYGDHLVVAAVAHFEALTGAPIIFDSITITGSAFFDSADPIVTGTLTLGPGNSTYRGASPELTINGLFTWESSADFIDSGVIHANGGLLAQPSSGTRNLTRVLNNAATATILGHIEVNPGARINNLPSGLIDFPVDGNMLPGSGGGAVTLSNAGIMRKTAGAGTTTLGTGAPGIRPTVENTGTVEALTGILAFNYAHYVQTAGATILNGGGISMTGAPPAPMQLQGGELTGFGTFTGAVNNTGGVVAPGLSAGSLTISGNYVQSAGGALEIELGGIAAGQFDVLTIGGTATLAGALEIATIDGYAPASGDSFVVLSAAALSGQFDAWSGPAGIDVSYTPTQVILTATSAACPGDADGDGVVNIVDLGLVLANFNATGAGVPGDVDGDGVVNIADLGLVLANFNGEC